MGHPRKVWLKAPVYYFRLDELERDERELILSARDATHQSHSPYSKFRVGAAVLLRTGEVIFGANQENASYGLTTCAERTTIFAANNLGHKRDIRKIAVTGRLGTEDPATYVGQTPLTPCGACRQVIKESEDLGGEPIVILMDCYDNQKIGRMVGIDGLLPLGFGPADFGMSGQD